MSHSRGKGGKKKALASVVRVPRSSFYVESCLSASRERKEKEQKGKGGGLKIKGSFCGKDSPKRRRGEQNEGNALRNTQEGGENAAGSSQGEIRNFIYLSIPPIPFPVGGKSPTNKGVKGRKDKA